MSSPALQQTPSPSRVPAPGPHIWIFALVVWTMLGLLSAAQRAAFNVYRGAPVDWFPLLPTQLADWWTCGIFTPAFYWMARRFPIQGRKWWSNVPVHMVAAVLFVPAKMAVFVPIFRALNPGIDRDFAG